MIEEINKNKYLEAALNIGLELCRDAIRAGNKCNWFGPSMEFADNKWQVIYRMPDGNLYSGTSGIGLYLSYLFSVTNEKLIKKTASAAMLHALEKADDIAEANRIGFYSGSLGIGFAAIQMGQLTDQQEFIERGLDLIRSHFVKLPPSEMLDIVSGSAGAIPVFLRIYRDYPEEFLLDLVRKHADHLIVKANKSTRGWSWSMPGINTHEDLVGYSHGVAGLSLALLEAYHATGNNIYKQGGEQGILYEQSWYNPDVENWPDMRKNNENSPRPQTFGYTCQWCHGAAGILLSRARAWEILGDQKYKIQAEAAARTTVKSVENNGNLFSSNYSLCHGLAGNASILVYASEKLKNKNLLEKAQKVANTAIEWYHSQELEWPSGITDYRKESPNLMLGKAGTGHFFLRLYDPLSISPLLIIDPQYH